MKPTNEYDKQRNNLVNQFILSDLNKVEVIEDLVGMLIQTRKERDEYKEKLKKLKKVNYINISNIEKARTHLKKARQILMIKNKD